MKSFSEWVEYVSCLEDKYQELAEREKDLLLAVNDKDQQIKKLEFSSKSVEENQHPHCFSESGLESGGHAIAISNLEKKLEEAKFDAISFFDKKCPYCSSDLYSGHVRTKIEIDHFYPISRGGQNVPW
ncbi:MAG: hypothetical protein ACPG4U_11030, partial [Pseudomonadales bacterium]